MKSSTLQPFNAAVVAIACTLMILEFETPDSGTLKALVEQWAVILSHYNSFFLIYLLWYLHAKEIERVDKVSPVVALLNGFWLFFITVIPFATNWVEQFPYKIVPQLTILILFSVCYLINNHIITLLIRDNPDVKFPTLSTLKDRLIVYVLLITALVNAFFFPIFNIVILTCITLFLIYLIFKYSDQDVRII